jgi:hypothetical protein
MRDISNTHSLFKPIPPEKYNGSPTIQKFFHFIKQTDEYLTDRQAPPEREVSIALKFLTDKAYDFYFLNASLYEPKTLVNYGLPDLRGARSGPPVRVIVRGSVLSASSPRVSLWPASARVWPTLSVEYIDHCCT